MIKLPLLALIFLLGLTRLEAQVSQASQSPKLPTDLDFNPKIVALGDWLTVVVTNPPPQIMEALAGKKKFVLLLRGEGVTGDIALKGLVTELITASSSLVQMRFHLALTDESRANWITLLRRPHYNPLKFSIALALDDGTWLAGGGSNLNQLEFVALPHWEFWFWAIFCVMFILAVFWLWFNSELIRDSSPAPVNKKFRPYSLARWQMAVWFVLVVMAFLFLRLITGGGLDSITPTVLALIGIGAGTALGAEAQEKSKFAKLQSEQRDLNQLPNPSPDQAKRKAELTQLLDNPQTAPTSRGFFEDILTDDVGLSLHRFQMFVWTIVLGVIFTFDVYGNLAMPEFSPTLLGLMGISSGTFLGFMLTEPHSSEQAKKSA